MTETEKKTSLKAALDKVKLKDKTGVSRAYKIAIANPNVGTVAGLQEAWIRFVEESIKSLEATSSTAPSALADEWESLRGFLSREEAPPSVWLAFDRIKTNFRGLEAISLEKSSAEAAKDEGKQGNRQDIGEGANPQRATIPEALPDSAKASEVDTAKLIQLKGYLALAEEGLAGINDYYRNEGHEQIEQLIEKLKADIASLTDSTRSKERKE